MIRIGVILGSTRPGRRGEAVARWVTEIAERHLTGVAVVEIVDLADYSLPLLDEPLPAKMGDYRRPHTRRWAATIGSYDGFVFVTPEYNHSIPAVLKNAIDFLFDEWSDKAAGFVTYGVHSGGVRAAEHLRLILGELKVADVRQQVGLSMFTDFEVTDPAETGTFTPDAHREPILLEMLDEVVSWSRALKTVRAVRAAA